MQITLAFEMLMNTFTVVDRDLGEYQGQSALRAIIPNNIPLPVAYGVFDLNKSKHFYIAEFHDMQERMPKPQKLISVLKQLHQGFNSVTDKFGFPVTTYKGYVPASMFLV